MNQVVGILLVDETQEGRIQLRKEVGAAGLSVMAEAGSSNEAFALAKQLQPDAILISMEEPVARSLRTIESLALALRDTPIIAVSSGDSRELLRKAVLAGARDFLSRPLRGKDLAETIQAVVKQGEKRRQSQASPDLAGLAQGTVVSVFGPKGGIGKTTLAINLGVAVATMSKEKVVLVDLDTSTGSAGVMLNLVPRKTILDMAENMHHMDRDLLKTFVTPHPSGMDLLAAPFWSQGADELSAEELAQVLTLLSSHYDYVVVDMPPQVTPLVFRVLQMSTYILFMTSLDVASIKACKQVLGKIGGWEFARDKIKVVTNAANSANSIGPGDIEEVLGYPVFWSIPFDPAVGAASQLGQPVVQDKPNSKASKAITELHYTLVGSKPTRGGGGLTGLFRRGS